MRKSYSFVADGKQGIIEANDGDSEGCSPPPTESYVELTDNGGDFANWEEYVTSDGSLFYAEYVSLEMEMEREKCVNEEGATSEILKKYSTPSTGKSHSRRHQSGTKATHEQKKSSEGLVFAAIDQSNDVCKVLELVITASDRYRFGRRSTAVESILGFRVVPFPDHTDYLMVDDMPALMQQNQQNPVSRGDWFKSLNNIEVQTSSVDDLLLQFTQPTKVHLKFHARKKTIHASGCNTENGRSTILKRILNTDMLVNLFELEIVAEQTFGNESIIMFGLLILPPECYQHDKYKNSLFFYPEDSEKNFLYKARGSFLTLHSVLSEELQTKPTASKLTYEGVQYYVCYRNINGFLALFSFPTSAASLTESNLRADELITYMNVAMSYMSLESFNNSDFRRLMLNFCKIQHARILENCKNVGRPVDCFKESHYLPLPKEGQLRILDALSEMDAMDYRSWNEEPLHTHREFFMCGNVLYYNHLMLVSQMSSEMRQYVEVFLRCSGIFSFVSKNSIKELYSWTEITLPNASGRHYLSICGRNHLILAVILKLFEPVTEDEDQNPENIAPSLFYIEEMQETVNHLIQCGIESLAMFWAASNKRPESLSLASLLKDLDMVNSCSSKKLDITHFKQKLVASPSAIGINSNPARSANALYDDETLLCSSLAGTSVHSLSPSEEETLKKRTIAAKDDDSDSGSDWENFSQFHRMRSANLEPEAQALQVKKSLLKEIANIVPVKISPGWDNSLLYFLYVDNMNSTVLCPFGISAEMAAYMPEIRRAILIIHHVLQGGPKTNCRHVGKVACQDVVPVKEYGTTIEIRDRNVGEQNVGLKMRLSVVGRFFLQPPRQVYICHRPDIPYNMVEIAFRLSFFPAG